jgi:hypothetical protein
MKNIVKMATVTGLAALWMGIISMSSCNERPTHPRVTDDPEEVWLRSFIMGYYEPEGVELRIYPGTATSEDPDTDYSENLVISMDVIKKETVGTFRDEGARKAVYDELCMKHDDMTFRQFYTLPVDGGMVEYPAWDLVWIDVVCDDRAFDAEHPAGMSLIDLIDCRLYSARPFIESGYCTDGCMTEDEYIYSIIEAPLSELNTEPDNVGPLSLIGMGNNDDLDMHRHFVDRMGRLIFKKGKPEEWSGTYNMTITFTTDELIDDPDSNDPEDKVYKTFTTKDKVVFE